MKAKDTVMGDDNALLIDNSIQQSFIVSFYDGDEEVGRLETVDGELRFTGRADKSAELFFNHFLKGLCDQYLRGNR
ncbi:hypothetical protein LCGC14_0572180 [marine sediment metagenome]|uniref:Uncharacterized protein n=1 Tax=marine sediment metagenome TaxID=412755 RepID=A0A0F9RIY8_9ZZZZ